MQISDMLARMGGLQSMARELGISEAQATRGAGGLAAMLDLDGDGNPLDDIRQMARKAVR